MPSQATSWNEGIRLGKRASCPRVEQAGARASPTHSVYNLPMHKAPKKDDLQDRLSTEQYRVTQTKGTERPFTGDLLFNKETGAYECVCCGHQLFRSDAKFDSGTGWPSFFKPAAEGAVAENADNSHGMMRVEAVCSKCNAHLGHVFPDGPQPTGMRYCVNSASLRFNKA